MSDKTYKSAVSLRGDCLYCPLPLSIDSYWNCEPQCAHCYMRRLNRTWGEDLRPADPDQVRRKLEAGRKNPDPKTGLAWALKRKITIRLGNKTDPFQDAELSHQVSRDILLHLIDLKWSFVLQTRFLANIFPVWDILEESHRLGLLTLMPIISPGGEWDWEVLERGRTTPIDVRFRAIKKALRRGWNVGVNGEPFIPGYHRTEHFEAMCRRLKEIGIQSYNTYNLHFNDWNAKEMHKLGIDIERIWEMNQDNNWKRIHPKLCQIATSVGIRLGCPDFVHTGPEWREKASTCCGIDVPNPSMYNTHHWKRMLQQGRTLDNTEEGTWQGIGDRAEGKKIICGERCGFYTMKDAGVI